MIITTLVENIVNKPDLLGEHGLSFLLESENDTILFDTGQGYTILHNAEKMGVDLSKVSKIVLSHGHYDHTDGLKNVLNVVHDANIYGHPNIFEKKYSRDGQKTRYIGMPYTKEELESKCVSLHLSRKPIQIADGICTTGEIDRLVDFETISDRLCVMRDGSLEKDDLLDDFSLIVPGRNGIAVVLGCGHSGIINTLTQVRKMTDNAPISIVMGGIHLIDANEDRIHKTIHLLSEFSVGKLALCHCTGMKALVEVYNAFGNKLLINNVGTRIEF